MNISKDDAERLGELATEIQERVNEFKNICRTAMTTNEYEQFRYRTLAHLEPGVSYDHNWVTTHSSIDPLEKVAENALGEVEEHCDVCECPKSECDCEPEEGEAKD